MILWDWIQWQTPLAEHNSTVLKGSSVEYLNKNKENWVLIHLIKSLWAHGVDRFSDEALPEGKMM